MHKSIEVLFASAFPDDDPVFSNLVIAMASLVEASFSPTKQAFFHSVEQHSFG